MYLLAWIDEVAVGHALVTPESKYPEIREQLGRLPELNGLGVADPYRRKGEGPLADTFALFISDGPRGGARSVCMPRQDRDRNREES